MIFDHKASHLSHQIHLSEKYGEEEHLSKQTVSHVLALGYRLGNTQATFVVTA